MTGEENAVHFWQGKKLLHIKISPGDPANRDMSLCLALTVMRKSLLIRTVADLGSR
jgi:hypothetical protein